MNRRVWLIGWVGLSLQGALGAADPLTVFEHPPAVAHAGVWWHWMGCNVTSNGIAADLAYFKRMGITSATIFGLADSCTPWAATIPNSPTAGLIAFTPRWWALVRYAAEEGQRLNIDIGLHNCPGYTSTGGPWIPPELAMRELATRLVSFESSNRVQTVVVPKPSVNPRAHANFPVINPATGKAETPVIPARQTDCQEVALLAFPDHPNVGTGDVREVTADFNLKTETLTLRLPPGKWRILRVCNIPMGSFTQPNQAEAFGLECDKMDARAVRFHLDHVLGELKAHLGGLVGTGLRHILLDSYEAGTPTWTPRMRDEFKSRRGYDLLPFLPTFAGLTLESAEATKKFQSDFSRTREELYRDNLYQVMGETLRSAGLAFACEPYSGPFVSRECIPYIDRVMTEFWPTRRPRYAQPHFDLKSWRDILGPDGRPHNVIEAESFTAGPEIASWDETPAILKPIGDQQFCRGVNRLILHSNPLQPWDPSIKPGIAMGRWGTHFGRNQTWAEPARAWFDYLARCQALLQWGEPSAPPALRSLPKDIPVGTFARAEGAYRVYFVANLSEVTAAFTADCPVRGQAPDWFDPVTGHTFPLAISSNANSHVTAVALSLVPYQSGFLVFRKPLGTVPEVTAARRLQGHAPTQPALTLPGPWSVAFDPAWGGPAAPVKFPTLTDWTACTNPAIRYFSGTATYRTCFDLRSLDSGTTHWLSLGQVNRQFAAITLNGRDLGTCWCEPYEVELPAQLLKANGNVLEIKVTNVWANRLIGDEQEAADCEWIRSDYPGGFFLKRFPDWFTLHQPRPAKERYCFTTWNYFTKNSPLVPSGLLGPVTLQTVSERTR